MYHIGSAAYCKLQNRITALIKDVTVVLELFKIANSGGLSYNKSPLTG